jgi:hypothetical protein
MGLSTRAGRVGRRAEHSDALDHAVRVGLVAYGVVHLLIAWLAVRLALGGGGGNASSTGALSQLAKNPAGRVSLYVVTAGFLALVVWQLLDAAVGHRDEDGGRRALLRAGSAAKAVVYGALGVSAFKVAMGSGGTDKTDSATARLMSAPFGQILVAIVGLVIVIVAGGLAYRGWTEKFTEQLNVKGNTGPGGKAVVVLGKAGYVSKGIALAIVGILFIWAALTHDPQHSGGLDQALHKVLQEPFGAPVLALIALGIACYGLFCFAWARHLDR